jgi:small GTP-binding protein
LGKIVNLKLGVYGEGAVGKTSLVNSFLGKEVPVNYSPTINSKVSRKEYLLKKTDITFKLNVWDVGGNRAINPVVNNAFFSDVDLALIVFDLTRPKLTLESYEKNFLDRINRYSEEPLILIVGNKIDNLILNNELKKAIQTYLGEKKSFSVTSATSEVNVINCFELLIYTFLKKSEILNPDLVPENSSLEFIKLIGKTEDELRDQLVNLISIDLKHHDLKPKIKIADVPSQEEDKEKKYQDFIQQEIEKISLQKIALSDKFIETIVKLENEINQLKRKNIKSSLELIDELVKSLRISQSNGEQYLELLIKLKREENELLIISSKFQEGEEDDLQKTESRAFEAKPKLRPLEAKPKPKSITELKPPEAKPKPKLVTKPKPLETKLKQKLVTKPKPLEAKPKPKSVTELKPPEAKPKLKPVTKPKSLEAKSKPKSMTELKPLETKLKPKLVTKPKPLEAKRKPKLVTKPKPLEAKPKPKSVTELKPLEAKPKLKLVTKPKSLEAKSKPKSVTEPKSLEAKPKSKLVTKPKSLESKPKPKLVKKLKPPEVKPTLKSKPKPSKTQLKEVKIASKPIKKDPKIEIYNEYERLNPGRRAVYRGKETKGFLEWKKNKNPRA